MSDRIEVNDILHPGQDRWSPNGRFQLIFQEDSNFVLYVKEEDSDPTPIWASDTWSDQGSDNKSVVLQADGHFVMYDAEGQPIWTGGNPEYGAANPYILVQDDGNVCLYDGEVEGCHWATGTNM